MKDKDAEIKHLNRIIDLLIGSNREDLGFCVCLNIGIWRVKLMEGTDYTGSTSLHDIDKMFRKRIERLFRPSSCHAAALDEERKSLQITSQDTSIALQD